MLGPIQHSRRVLATHLLALVVQLKGRDHLGAVGSLGQDNLKQQRTPGQRKDKDKDKDKDEGLRKQLIKNIVPGLRSDIQTYLDRRTFLMGSSCKGL